MKPRNSDDQELLSGKRLLLVVNVAWAFLLHRKPIALAAKAAGMDVHVAADIAQPSEVEEIRALGIQFHRIGLQRGGTNPIADFWLGKQLYKLVRDVKPNILHNVTAKPVIYGTLLAGRDVEGIVNAVSGLGYAYTGEEFRRKLLQRIVSTGYRYALRDDRVRLILQNRDDVQQFQELKLIAPEQVRLIRGSGVDLGLFRPSPEPSGRPLVVLPARVLKDKGVLEFARAAAIVRERGIDARFAIVGGLDRINPAAISESEIKDLEHEFGIEWLGQSNDMPSVFSETSIVCLPSYREGLPKALIEACASGRPIITTNVPGCREMVDPGSNGLLVNARDHVALASALIELLGDRELRAQMGVNARRLAEQAFGIGAIVSQTLDIYREFYSHNASRANQLA